MQLHPLIATIVLTGLALPAWADGNPDAGQKVYRKCAACHDVEEAKNKVGPHLVGIVGRSAASVDDFAYSDAMAGSGLVWDEDNLAAYLRDPKGFLDGNKMAFPGLKKDAEIADLIAYLKAVDG